MTLWVFYLRWTLCMVHTSKKNEQHKCERRNSQSVSSKEPKFSETKPRKIFFDMIEQVKK